jgi:hypothetical protein
MAKKMTPLKAIRTKCLDCMGGSPGEVRRCNIPGCSLHEYRFGSNPALKGKRGNSEALSKYRRSFQKKPSTVHDSEEVTTGQGSDMG